METRIRFQNLDWTREVITKRFKKNPNSSVSALFRHLRKSPNLSLFADAPIISQIVNTLRSIGINPERHKVAYALRQSQELRGNRAFLNSLFTSTSRAEQNKIEPGRNDKAEDGQSAARSEIAQKGGSL